MSKILNLRKKQGVENSTPPPKRTFKKSLVSPVQNKTEVPTQAQKITPLPSLSWEAPSFYFNPQKKYLSLLVIALVIGGGGLIFFNGDMLTAIFLLLSSAVLVLYSTKHPEINKVTVDQRGVTVGETIYFYKDLKSFWIHYDPGNLKELSLESRRWYLPHIKVSIENESPIEIRALMVNFLPEREHEYSLIDIVSRKLGL